VKWPPAWNPIELSVGNNSTRAAVTEESELKKSPVCYICCQETASGDCNRMRTLVCVCQRNVRCSSEWCTKVINKSNIQ
jgi:hypothetical protein